MIKLGNFKHTSELKSHRIASSFSAAMADLHLQTFSVPRLLIFVYNMQPSTSTQMIRDHLQPSLK